MVYSRAPYVTQTGFSFIAQLEQLDTNGSVSDLLYIHIPRAPMTFIFEGQPLKHCLFQAKQGSFGF